MYVNGAKKNAEEATVLCDGDEICFGAMIPNNELKYTFLEGDGTAAVLNKVLHSSTIQETEFLPPAEKKLKQDTSVIHDHAFSPPSPFSSSEPQPLAQPPCVKQCSSNRPSGSSQVQQTTDLHSKGALGSECVSVLLTSTEPSQVTKLTTSPLPIPSSVKPSPALSIASTQSTDLDIDDLFTDISYSNDKLLEEAMFGGSSSSSNTLPVANLDGATIQVMAVQDQMQQEKHKLLSSIEALKVELAAKNELISLKEQKDGNIVSSMKEEFVCVICQELFINAHTLPCAHSFCDSCIGQWRKQGHKQCPICRKHITSNPVRSLVLDNAIFKVEAEMNEEEKQERKLLREDRQK